MSIHVSAIAAQLRAALHDGDTTVLTALFHPDVRFEPLDQATAATNGSTAALAWYEDRRSRGFRTRVEELFAYPGSVVLGLRISRPDCEPDDRPLLYRLFRLKDDQVVHIRDFTDRTHALDHAELPAPSAN